MLGPRHWLYGCILLLAALGQIGCERRSAPVAPAGKEPRIASLVPAATDLLLEMGAGDHLVAVSDFDVVAQALPRVGGYQNTDWEALAVLRPRYLITQVADSRLAAGFVQRAHDLGIERVNVTTDRLDDVYATLRQLGDVAQESAGAAALEQRIRRQIDEVRAAARGLAPVKTLMVLDAEAQSGVGPDNFLDDLLTEAGGANVLGAGTAKWPALDAEELLGLKPQVVLVLMPGASPQVRDRARAFWAKLGGVPAVTDGRVYVLDDWWVQEPGAHVGALAARMEQLLHGPLAPGGAVAP